MWEKKTVVFVGNNDIFTMFILKFGVQNLKFNGTNDKNLCFYWFSTACINRY